GESHDEASSVHGAIRRRWGLLRQRPGSGRARGSRARAPPQSPGRRDGRATAGAGLGDLRPLQLVVDPPPDDARRPVGAAVERRRRSVAELGPVPVRIRVDAMTAVAAWHRTNLAIMQAEKDREDASRREFMERMECQLLAKRAAPAADGWRVLDRNHSPLER